MLTKKNKIIIITTTLLNSVNRSFQKITVKRERES
jgi:hypothetical protein